jgi:hypothetical protein
MTDLSALADLSHDLERLALSLADGGVDQRVVADELGQQAAGKPEVAAIALSYLLRRRTLGAAPPEPAVLDVAVDAMVTALRRLPPRPA